MEKLEALEGNLVKEVFNNSVDKNAVVIGGVNEVEVKVRGRCGGMSRHGRKPGWVPSPSA